ncbi:hypothetical protein I0C86_32275 [Plantactinospora sp. S1510]|uniref:Uncharacterized protein n=1 Tax=Plantactinospora alkalitolerans TaxID=2789879 RepID=A0ABS0H540_9ACTN|nr:hypothetical protein [Plantactinospora alkalitolerans]MBF9133579.1 hypothetical protein [Plantactinospora alkalitolerans]
MGVVLPVVLFALGGVLIGGAWSLHRQGAPRGALWIVGALAVLATAGGVLWLLPGEGG